MLSLYIKRVSLLVRDLSSREIHSLYSLHVSSEFFIMHWAILQLTPQRSLRFQIFIFCTISRGYYKTYNTLQERKKNKTTNYINHQRWNVRSDQGNLGFRVSYCHVELTGVDIYIKLQVTYTLSARGFSCAVSGFAEVLKVFGLRPNFGRRSVGLRPTSKPLIAREKKPLVPRVSNV